MAICREKKSPSGLARQSARRSGFWGAGNRDSLLAPYAVVQPVAVCLVALKARQAKEAWTAGGVAGTAGAFPEIDLKTL
jgi:hypothetical protein